MRTIVRVALVLAGAAGFCAVLSLAASADVVNPRSALNLASRAMVGNDKGAAPKAQPDTAAPAAEPQDSASIAKGAGTVPATPAPEQQVRQAPPQIAHTGSSVAGSRSPIESAVRPLRIGAHTVGSYLGRVVSACQVGFGSGTGGPVLVLAVLGLVAALERRRAFGFRSATDEDVPEFLYAGEISPPG